MSRVVCRPIIVLGAERSGTSLCAEMVHAWGAYAGEDTDLAGADEQNPRGRWEYRPLWDLLAAVGHFDSGMSWWSAGFAEHVAAQVGDPLLACRARELLARMESRGEPWMWKDPALCHFLGFWRAFWKQPIFVIAVRHPVDIATSWQRFRVANGRAATSLRCNLLRWQHMMLSVLRRTTPDSSTLFVEYEQVTNGPLEQSDRLALFLDRECDGKSDPAVVRRMARVCDPELRRNRKGSEREAEMTVPQRSLYRFMRAKVAEPNLPFRDTFPVPPDWRATVMEEEAR
jgi:O-antigen biosynthesis protein